MSRSNSLRIADLETDGTADMEQEQYPYAIDADFLAAYNAVPDNADDGTTDMMSYRTVAIGSRSAIGTLLDGDDYADQYRGEDWY